MKNLIPMAAVGAFLLLTAAPFIPAQQAGASRGSETQITIPSVSQFGARADGQGDNLKAFQDAIRTLALDKKRGGRLFIPPGRYHFSAPLHISRGMVLEGGSGAGRNAGTLLIFDPGVDGIIVDRTTTSEDGGAGDWTVIRDLAVMASNPAGSANGITLHARARLENLYVRGFGGNGIEINAQARGRGANTNANNWSMENVFVEQNGGNGFHAIGADANAGVAVAVSAMGNGGWGFLDESFLGNTYVGCHTEANKKGGYSVVNPNARSLFIGSYTEGGQPNNQINRPSMVLGGLFGTTQGSGFLMTDGWISPNWGIRNQKDPKVTTSLGFAGDVPRGVLSLSASDGSLPYRLEYQRSDIGWWELNYGEAGNGTAISFSTSKAEGGGGQLRFPNGFSIGRGASTHKFSAALAPPTSGEHQPGEVVFSSDPAQVGYLGWVAVQAGNPGQWVPFGALLRSKTSVVEGTSSGAHFENATFPTHAQAAGTLTFDATSGTLQKVVLHADVNSSTIAHLAAGTHLDFLICQDADGGHYFYWPENVRGGMRVGITPRSCSAQSFVFDGRSAYATSSGAVTASAD